MPAYATLFFYHAVAALLQVFVYMDAWKQSFIILGDDRVCTLRARTLHTVRQSGHAVFVTSLTTSCAFFANCASPIINIKCFGVFAGLLVMADYVLMMAWLPVVVVIHHK